MAGGTGGAGGSPNGSPGAGGQSTPVQDIDSSFWSGVAESIVASVTFDAINPLIMEALAPATYAAAYSAAYSQALIDGLAVSDATTVAAQAGFSSAAAAVSSGEALVSGQTTQAAMIAAASAYVAVPTLASDTVQQIIVNSYKNNSGQLGGAGGTNSATVSVGGITYGPYGQGGGGGDSNDISGEFGFGGGVVLWWGNGINPGEEGTPAVSVYDVASTAAATAAQAALLASDLEKLAIPLLI